MNRPTETYNDLGRGTVGYLARALKRLEASRAPIVSIEQFKGSLIKFKDSRYRLACLVMYYSGARIEEAVRLGQAVRVALHYNRGRKGCDFLRLSTGSLRVLQRQASTVAELILASA